MTKLNDIIVRVEEVIMGVLMAILWKLFFSASFYHVSRA